MKKSIAFLTLLIFCISAYPQKQDTSDKTRDKDKTTNTGDDKITREDQNPAQEKPNQDTVKVNRQQQETRYTTGNSGVRRSIHYKFSKSVQDDDPGSGIFRYSNDTISNTKWIYTDNLDLSGEDQTNWYETWDDTTGATGRGSINIAEFEGKNLNAFNITGVFIKEKGYWKFPVEFISGNMPSDGAIYYFIFNRIEHKKPQPAPPEEQALNAQPAAEAQPVTEEPSVPVPEVSEPSQPPLEVQPVVEEKPPVQVVDVIQPLQPVQEAKPVSEEKPTVQVTEVIQQPQPVQQTEIIKKPLPEEEPVLQHRAKPETVQKPQPVSTATARPATQATGTQVRRTNEPVQTAQTTQTKQPEQTIQAKQPVQTTQAAPAKTPVQASRTSQQQQTVQQPQQTQTTQTTKPVQQAQAYQPAPYNQVSQVNKPADIPNPYANLTMTSAAAHRKCYRGIIELGYALGLGEYGISNFRLNFINGIMVGRSSSIGLGIGYRRYFPVDYADRELYSPSSQVPVFLDLRTSFTTKKVTPYLALGLGGSASFIREGSDTTTTRQEGFYLCPSGGIWFNLSERFAVFTGIAFEIQKLEYILLSDDSHFKKNSGSLSLNIGIAF